MDTSSLGKEYSGGDVVLRQGERTDGMFVIQEGEVEVLHKRDGTEIRLNTLSQPDFLGEVPFFERVQASGVVRATIRALGDVRVLTVDKSTIVRRLHERSRSRLPDIGNDVEAAAHPGGRVHPAGRRQLTPRHALASVQPPARSGAWGSRRCGRPGSRPGVSVHRRQGRGRCWDCGRSAGSCCSSAPGEFGVRP